MRIVDLGLMRHPEAEKRQMEALASVMDGGEETLFLVEHPKVITLGLQGGGENLHVSREYLESQGIELVQTRRGGNITCHFPGQLVAYPVFRVERRPGGIHRFFADMEEAVIRTTASFGVSTVRRPGYPGVWMPEGGRKICSMGIGVKHFVTYHGLALNVAKDVSLFDLITLCGIGGAHATSLSLEAGRTITVKEVKDVLVREFRALFAHSALAAHAPAQE